MKHLIPLLCISYALLSHADVYANDRITLLNRVAEKLAEAYKTKRVKKTAVVLPIQGVTIDLQNREFEIIRTKFIASIQRTGVTVLDIDSLSDISEMEKYQASGQVRDSEIQGLGDKIGAEQVIRINLKDVSQATEPDVEKILLIATLKATNIKRGSIDRMRTINIEYTRRAWKVSYAMRDMSIASLAAVKWLSLGGCIYLANLAGHEKMKGKEASDSQQADEYLEQSELSYKLAYGSFALFAGSWLGEYHLKSKPRNRRLYYEYELSMNRFNDGALGLRLSFDLP